MYNGCNQYAEAFMDYIDSMQELMGIVSREIEILRKAQREMLEIKHRNR